MTRLEWFDAGCGLVALKAGVLTVDLMIKYDTYKSYRDFLEAGEPDDKARVLTKKKCRCHYSSVARAIYWFERDDPANETDRAKVLRRRSRAFRLPENVN